MFEKEIKFIADFSLNQIKKLGSSFTFEKMANSELHPSIIKFISADIDHSIQEDRKKLLAQSSFDYSGSGIAKYFNLIGEQIKKSQRIPFDDVKKMVLHAVSFNANYVVQPKNLLVKQIFRSSGTKSIEEIKDAFNYIYYYDYIKEILLGYLSKRKILNLSSSEFELILNKIDKELFTSQKKDELLADALYSIADFYNIGGTTRTKLSPSFAEQFLKEKNLDDYLIKLKEGLSEYTKQKYEADEIKNILFTGAVKGKPQEAINEETETINEEFKPSFNLPEKIEPEEQIIIEKEPEIKAEEKKIQEEADLASNEGIIPIHPDEVKLFVKGLEVDKEKKPEIKSDIEEVEFDLSEKKNLDSLYEFDEPDINNREQIEEEEIYIDDKDELEWAGDLKGDFIKDKGELKDKKKNSAKKPEAEIEFEDETVDKTKRKNKKSPRDLFSFLSDKDIEKIVGSIFNDDRDDFANSMEKIAECYSYEEATEILKSIFVTYRVNPYSKDAVVLTNAVSNYFDQF